MVPEMSAILNHRSVRRRPSGFTLIEVMVTLALTMLMMVMFGSLFQITANFVTRQKGVGENDQSARILTTVLRSDLQARTMRLLAPFHPKMSAIGGTFPDSSRRGYFEYSENNPADDTDDVLQFTVDTATLPTGYPLQNTQLSGLGTCLPVAWQPNTVYQSNMLVRPTSASTATGFVYKNKTGANLTSGGAEPTWNTTVGGTTADGGGNWTTLLSPLNQPDGDDGVIVYDQNGNLTLNPAGGAPNNTGASQYAEVSYFLRHGSLIRRVLLLRQPYSATAGNAQPYDTDPAPMIPGLYPPYPATAGSGNFWTDFDYSARIQPLTPAGAPTGVSFLGGSPGSAENSLDNTGNGSYSDPLGATVGSQNETQIPIGRPDCRFGHDQAYIDDGTTANVRNGPPREFDSNSTSTINGGLPQFFGRYTHEETSNSAFLFPGNLPTGGSPMGWTTGLTLDSTRYTMSLGNPATTSLAGGPRRGEDILLTNVVSFDVKIWDPLYSESANSVDVNRNGVIDSLGGFADVGHSAPAGCFRGAGSTNGTANVLPTYGPTPNTVGGTPSNNNVFDTWYRWFNFDNTTRNYDNADQNVPYAPLPIGRVWAFNGRRTPLMLSAPRWIRSTRSTVTCMCARKPELRRRHLQPGNPIRLA